MMSLVAGVFGGLGMFFGGLFGMHPSAQAMGTSTPSSMGGEHRMGDASSTPGAMRMGSPGLVGTVTSVSGTTITISVIQHESKSATSTASYTIDASSAKFIKFGSHMASSSPLSISTINIGDRILAVGTLSGTSMVAKLIEEGIPALLPMLPPGVHHVGGMQPLGSSTPGMSGGGGMGGPMHRYGMGSSTPGGYEPQ